MEEEFVIEVKSWLPMSEIENIYLVMAYDATGCNKSKTAEILGMNVKTVYNRLNKLDDKQREYYASLGRFKMPMIAEALISDEHLTIVDVEDAQEEAEPTTEDLNSNLVRWVRRSYSEGGRSIEEIARVLEMPKAGIRSIVRGEVWLHAGGPIQTNLREGD